MSGRRSRSRPQGHQHQSSGSDPAAAITDDQVRHLVSNLQQLLPELRSGHSNKVPAARVLQETCNYIRSLQREVDDLSERLSELLATSDSAEAAIIRRLLSQ